MIMGLFLCFLLPGILIGLLFGQSMRTAKEKTRLLHKKRAMENRRRLYVYDLRGETGCAPCKRAA